MSDRRVPHGTAHRLRWRLLPDADGGTLETDPARLSGVMSVRINRVDPCVVVQHDGGRATRADELQRRQGDANKPAQRRRTAVPAVPAPEPARIAEVAAGTPALLAMALPVLQQSWRSGAARAVVGMRG